MDHSKLKKAEILEELKLRDAEISALKKKLRKVILENMVLQDIARSRITG